MSGGLKLNLKQVCRISSMSAQTICSWDKVVCGQLSYSDARANVNGKGKSVLQAYTGKKLVVQTPKLYVPFSVSEFKDDVTKATKYTVVCSLKGVDAGFRSFLENIDNMNVETGATNNKDWFGDAKTSTPEIIADRYRKILKEHPNGKYDAQFRVKLPFNSNGRFDGLVFDSAKQPCDISCIEPGCNVRMLMELSNIYIADKTFGQVLKAIQIQVFKPERISSFAFEGDDEDEHMSQEEEESDEEVSGEEGDMTP